MLIVCIVVGALLGLALTEGTGALLGGAVGWLVWRVLKLERELNSLKQRDAAPAPGAKDAPAPAWTAPPAPPLQPPPEPDPEPAEPTPGLAEPATAAPASPAPVAQQAPGWLSAVREWFFGGNTIVKAGIGILFIGLAFLAKYASEHVEVPIELRLAGIAAVAVLLLAIGWRLRLRRPGYAQVLQGGAIAVLYLTLFSAFRFYGLVGAGAAFALMALVAVLAAALAVLQNVQSLAAIGALGGFATPILLSTGGGSHVGLFGFYLLLDLGIAAVAWFRTWRWLNLIGFAFTFGVAALWGATRYGDEHYLSAQLFLIAFFAVFLAVLLLPARRVGAAAETLQQRSDRWVNGTLLFGLPTIAFGLQYGLVHDTRFGAALAALVLAAVYVGLARMLRARPGLGLAFEGCLAVGTVFITLVIPLALDARATAGAWALEAAGLVWLGWRQQRRLARAFGYALLLIAAGLLFHAIDARGAPTSLLNATLLSGLMFIAGALLAALFVQRHAAAGAAMPGEAWAEAVCIAAALLAAVALCGLHVHALLAPEWRLAAFIVCAAALALLLTGLAARLAWPGAALPLLGYAALLGLAAMLSAGLQTQPLAHGGWWAWPVALAVHLATLKWAAVFWPPPGQHLVHALGALVLALLGALVGRGLLSAAGDAGSAWPWLGWLALPAGMLLLLPRESLARWWPLQDRPEAYQASAGAVLAAAMLVWTLLANAVSNGAATPLPYLPLLNPLDLGIALALFAAWRWSESSAGRQWLAETLRWPQAQPVLLGAFGFVWLNAMLVRAFHHLGGVPFEFDAWVVSLPVQTGLTLLWAATALPLMWVSARRGMRAPWMVGAALLALVVLKLLLVDLSASGTVTRIVSFIGAGVLMLVIGYVAPLPGKEPAHAKD